METCIKINCCLTILANAMLAVRVDFQSAI